MAHTFIKRTKAETGESPLPILRGDELHARPAPSWLIAGAFAQNSLGCLYGEPGVGKTLVAVYLGLSIANDLRCLGGRAVTPGPVVYITGEGEGWFQYRVDAWVQRHSNVPHPRANFYALLQAVNLLDRQSGTDLLTNTA